MTTKVVLVTIKAGNAKQASRVRDALRRYGYCIRTVQAPEDAGSGYIKGSEGVLTLKDGQTLRLLADDTASILSGFFWKVTVEYETCRAGTYCRVSDAIVSHERLAAPSNETADGTEATGTNTATDDLPPAVAASSGGNGDTQQAGGNDPGEGGGTPEPIGEPPPTGTGETGGTSTPLQCVGGGVK